MYFITETTVGLDFRLTTTGKLFATRVERSTGDPNWDLEYKINSISLVFPIMIVLLFPSHCSLIMSDLTLSQISQIKYSCSELPSEK